MRFTLITATYNAAATVERALRSVLKQTLPHEVEYWVIDGGSTDGTLELIAKYEHLLAGMISERDGGPYEAMNKGISRATGDWIGIINADDWLAPDALEQVVAVAASSPDAGVVVGAMVRVTVDGQLGIVVPPPRRFSCHRSNNHPATFVRREVYARIGPFDLGYPIAADLEFVLRAQRDPSVTVVTTPAVLAYMTSGGTSYGFNGTLEACAIDRRYAGVVSAARLFIRKTMQKSSRMALKRVLPGTVFSRLQQFWWRHRYANAYLLSQQERGL